MESPDVLDAAFRQGCLACASGELRASNPHDPNTEVGAAWTRGWVYEYRALPLALQNARRAKEPVLVDLHEHGL